MWTPFNFFIGIWQGTGEGKAGISQVERKYEFVLNSKFIFVQSKSIYDPQETNPKGEVHEEWGLISYDRARETYIFRQFHIEGFVNQYVLQASTKPGVLVFVSEALENIPAGYRARETYTLIGNDEIEELFEIAEPGKEFVLYSKARLKRLP